MNKFESEQKSAKNIFFLAAPDDRGEMMFGEVSGGESRARHQCLIYTLKDR